MLPYRVYRRIARAHDWLVDSRSTDLLLCCRYVVTIELNLVNLDVDKSLTLLITILHFLMMHYLDKKPTDDRKYLAQPYVTILSLLLVSSFKTSLSSALAIAFAQHM
jgi:hypothetical protein